MDDTPNLIVRIGEALYGPMWQTAMSQELGVNDRTVRRWASGEFEPRPGVYLDLLRIATEHVAEIEGLLEPLKLAATPGVND